jgi:hypothetical protein
MNINNHLILMIRLSTPKLAWQGCFVVRAFTLMRRSGPECSTLLSTLLQSRKGLHVDMIIPECGVATEIDSMRLVGKLVLVDSDIEVKAYLVVRRLELALYPGPNRRRCVTSTRLSLVDAWACLGNVW